MDLLRQNTDYAFRLMLHLTGLKKNEYASARIIAGENGVSYDFACKILQQLHEAGLIQSAMGPRGGYALARPAEQIQMSQIIEAMQGPVLLNQCMACSTDCDRKNTCPVTDKLRELQNYIVEFLGNVSLAELYKLYLQKSKADV